MSGTIDLNGDVGESFGAWSIGNDAELIPLVTSVNIACGAHAGDPLVMRRTLELAVKAGAGIGAHPGYPDLQGFGRRPVAMSRDELIASLLYQLGALVGVARGAGQELRHVKPHGALYNRAAVDEEVAAAIAEAVAAFSKELILVGLAGSRLVDAGKAAGLRVAPEGFADRAYESDGTLRSRELVGALLPTAAAAAEQAVAIARDRRVRAHDGSWVSVEVNTICIHGDTPRAVEYAREIRRALEAAGVTIERLSNDRE